MEQSEMTLKEWCSQLPKSHRVNRELNELLETDKWANAMTAAGVDNWDGYEDALDMIED